MQCLHADSYFCKRRAPTDLIQLDCMAADTEMTDLLTVPLSEIILHGNITEITAVVFEFFVVMYSICEDSQYLQLVQCQLSSKRPFQF